MVEPSGSTSLMHCSCLPFMSMRPTRLTMQAISFLLHLGRSGIGRRKIEPGHHFDSMGVAAGCGSCMLQRRVAHGNPQTSRVRSCGGVCGELSRSQINIYRACPSSRVSALFEKDVVGYAPMGGRADGPAGVASLRGSMSNFQTDALPTLFSR